MGMNFEAVGARISRLQAHDLPAALSGLLRQAELALKPASKTVKCKGSGLSTVQKRALVTAIVLLLEKAGTELNCGVVREDLQTQLQAAFQQHSWLWERILRVNLADVLQSPGAALLIMQVLLSLTSTHQARALNLIRKQLSQGLRISPSAAEQASCSAILSLVLSHLKRCFPVVSYVLPSSDTAAQSSSSQQLSPGRSSSQVKVSLAEQLPALLHLALILAAPCPEGRGAQADVLAGLHTRNSCSTVPQSTSESDAGLESHMAPPGLAASRVASQQMGVCTKEASGAGKTCMPQKSAGTMAPSFVGHVVEDQHRGDSLSGQAEEVLQYAVLLLSRLESPERLHELLGFGQGSAPDQLPDPEGSWSREGPTGRLRSSDLSKIHAAQQCMEVMLEALLTIPGFAAATAKQPHSSVTSSATRAQLAPPYEEVLQRCQGQEGQGRGEGPGPYGWWAAVDGHPWQGSARAESYRAVLQQANKTVAVLLALHWELTKLEAACLAAPQGRSSRGQLPHLSPRGCLQLLRASTCKPKTAPSARLLASMPRAGAAMSQLPPAVQLLLPPAIMAHALELASRAMGSSGAASWLGGSPDGANVANSNDGEDSHCSGNNATCGAAPQPGESLLAERSRDRQGRGLLGELAERVLDIQQAAFQGLEQPRAVLYGPLHRQVISAASKLHSLLTQPPVAPAKGCAADADAVAASAVCDIGAEDVLDGEGVGASRRLPSDRKRRLSCLSDAVLARGGSGSVKRGRDAAAAARTQQLPGTFLETAAAQGSSAHLKVRAAKGTSQRTSPGSFGRDGLHANPVAELLLLFEQQLPAEAVLATHAVVAEGPQTTEDSQAAGRASGPAATGRTRSRDAAVRRRLVPQQVVQSSLAQRTQHAQHGEVAAQHCAVDHPTLARGRYADHDARTAAASSRGDPPAGAAPAAARTRQEGTSNPEEQGAGEKSSASALYLGADAAEGGWEGPAMGQALAAVQRAQQEGGRVILTAAAALDDAGREALWEAYISDKEYLVEMLGDSNYQEWYDEEAHPLPELHTSRLKGVDAVLDEALGSPLGGEGLEGSGDEAPPPPGPQTLLAASVQLPWQATLAAALQLLCCCLGLAVSSANGRAGRNSSIRGGHGCGAASEVHASQPAGGESSRAQLVALSLFEALEPKQRGEAAVAAARLATPHCSSVAAAKAIRGAGSRPLGAVLLIFAVQLHEVVHRRTGCRTAPVLLSAYTSLLDALLPLAQHEELHIKCAIPGSAKRAPTTPLLLLPPVLLCVLESPRLLPSSLLPRTLCCLLRLSRPCTPQDAITQHASLLWALLLPRPSRRSALPPPCWVATPTCTQLLRRLKPALAAAAAQELLQLLSADWEAWEQHGAMKEEPPPHSLGRRALPVQSAGDAAGGGGPQGSSRSRLRKKKPARGTKAKASECGVAENASHQQLGALSQTGNMPQRVQKGGAEGAGQDSDRDWKQLSGDAMMEGLLPAVDLCCFALTQMAAQQQRQMYQQNAWCEEMEGVGGVAGPLCHPSVGALVLTLCQQLVSYCTSLLQRLSCCLDSATQESSPCPPGISQAGLMWAVSLEMKSCLEQADAVVLPQSALARQQQLLREALQELGGVQYCCAELAKGLPEHHSAYQALVAAMDSAPSLSTFSTQAGNEGAEEQGANGCLGGAETETGRQQGSRGCAPNGQGPLEKKKEDDGRHQRRRLQDIKNPFLRAMIAEGGNHVDDLAGDDLSDLEDFIVYNPEKDYQQLFAQHFPAALDSGDNDVEETDDEGIGDGLEEEGREPLHKLPDVPRWSHSAISSSHPKPAKPGASGQLRQLIPHT